MTKLIFVLALSHLILMGCATNRAEEKDKSTLGHVALCKSGTIRSGFISPAAPAGNQCPRGRQTCLNGQWDGPRFFDSCESSQKNCGESSHGTVITGFISAKPARGLSCVPATKTCLDGKWFGPRIVMKLAEQRRACCPVSK
jgi:hypothetical protein